MESVATMRSDGVLRQGGGRPPTTKEPETEGPRIGLPVGFTSGYAAPSEQRRFDNWE
jgi:hypothetical protein